MNRVGFVLALALGSGLVVPARAGAQCAPADWSSLSPPHGVNDLVSALHVWDPDGPGPATSVLVAGGWFTAAGSGTPVSHIVAWDGSTWQSLNGGVLLSSGVAFVQGLTTYNGDLIAGGLFDSAGGVPVNNIARWNGTSWQPLGAGLGGQVYTLTTHNGDLIAGGFFATAGGASAPGIARWNGTTWQGLASGTQYAPGQGVPALTIFNGDLVAGGFWSPGGAGSANVARWNGAAWSPLGNGLLGPVYGLTVYQGELIAAGGFTSSGPIGAPGSVPVYFVAKWNGTTWSPTAPGAGGFNGDAFAATVFNGSLVVGGGFTFAGGIVANHMAQWNGASWQALGSGVNGIVHALADGDGTLVVGGTFTFAGMGLAAPNLARWRPPMTLAFSQPAGPGTGIFVTNTGLLVGHEYYNIASLELCPGGPGSGPLGGLCFNDFTFLLYELSFPIGFHPFHFAAGGSSLMVGPYFSIPWSLEAVCVDVTGGTAGCISPVASFTIQ